MHFNQKNVPVIAIFLLVVLFGLACQRPTVARGEGPQAASALAPTATNTPIRQATNTPISRLKLTAIAALVPALTSTNTPLPGAEASSIDVNELEVNPVFTVEPTAPSVVVYGRSFGAW